MVGTFEKGCADWWIEYFKNLRHSGLYNDKNVIHRECLKYCFMDLMQEELHRVVLEWNVHRIRPSANLESPFGKPDILYFLPEMKGAQDYSTLIDIDQIEIADHMCATRPQAKGCPASKDLAEMIMEDEQLDTPTTIDKACQLYFVLFYLIDDF